MWSDNFARPVSEWWLDDSVIFDGDCGSTVPYGNEKKVVLYVEMPDFSR